jgi:hypothetical protein
VRYRVTYNERVLEASTCDSETQVDTIPLSVYVREAVMLLNKMTMSVSCSLVRVPSRGSLRFVWTIDSIVVQRYG